MFGRNDFTETVKTALSAAGCDTTAYRSWQKQYEKLKKKKKEEEARYRRCREKTLRVQEDARLMEHMLTVEQTTDRRAFGQQLKELKQMQGSFDHEFLIGKEDREFHSTYDTILRLGLKALEEEDQRLLLQSEIENLLELIKENLEKEEPKMQELAFFYLTGSDAQLAELPPAEKYAQIKKHYEHEFVAPVMRILEDGIARAADAPDYIKENRGSRRKAEAAGILMDCQAETIFRQIMAEL